LNYFYLNTIILNKIRMSPIYTKIHLAKVVGELLLGKSLAEPRYTIDKQCITIYNFVSVDENGYQDTQDFIELAPTSESYNLLDNKSRKISVRKCALFDKEQREIIINAIRVALVETNQSSQTSNIYILKDLSILVSSDDWSENHEMLH
jgi:hypothetical protein